MQDFMKKFLSNQIVLAVLSIIFGLVLIIGRSSAVAFLVQVLGWMLIIAGVVNVILYIARKYDRNPSQIATAVLLFIFGIFFVAWPNAVVSIFPIIMGLVLIFSSVTNIAGIAGAPLHGGAWGFSLVMAILSLILGIVVLIHPIATANVLYLFIGITYLINGISDLMVISAIGK